MKRRDWVFVLKGSNNYADYYHCTNHDPLLSVRYAVGCSRPLICLTCCVNECEHTQALAAQLGISAKAAA